MNPKRSVQIISNLRCQVRDLNTIVDVLHQKLRESGIQEAELDSIIDTALSQPRLASVSVSTYQLSRKVQKLSEENSRLSKLATNSGASTVRRSSAPLAASDPSPSQPAASTTSRRDRDYISQLESKLALCEAELELERQRAEKLTIECRQLAQTRPSQSNRSHSAQAAVAPIVANATIPLSKSNRNEDNDLEI